MQLRHISRQLTLHCPRHHSRGCPERSSEGRCCQRRRSLKAGIVGLWRPKWPIAAVWNAEYRQRKPQLVAWRPDGAKLSGDEVGRRPAAKSHHGIRAAHMLFDMQEASQGGGAALQPQHSVATGRAALSSPKAGFPGLLTACEALDTCTRNFFSQRGPKQHPKHLMTPTAWPLPPRLSPSSSTALQMQPASEAACAGSEQSMQAQSSLQVWGSGRRPPPPPSASYQLLPCPALLPAILSHWHTQPTTLFLHCAHFCRRCWHAAASAPPLQPHCSVGLRVPPPLCPSLLPTWQKRSRRWTLRPCWTRTVPAECLGEGCLAGRPRIVSAGVYGCRRGLAEQQQAFIECAAPQRPPLGSAIVSMLLPCTSCAGRNTGSRAGWWGRSRAYARLWHIAWSCTGERRRPSGAQCLAASAALLL